MAQKILVIDAHPDPARDRFCHMVSDAYLRGAMDAGKETRLITLAETAVDMLRTAQDFAQPPESTHIRSARDDILWADHLVLIFPLWMGGAPALLHAFLEQVARANFFATTSGPGISSKFKGKTARVITTMGMPAIAYRLFFGAHGVRSLIQGVLGFAGFGSVRATYWGAIEATPRKRQQTRLQRARDLGRDGR